MGGARSRVVGRGKEGKETSGSRLRLVSVGSKVVLAGILAGFYAPSCVQVWMSRGWAGFCLFLCLIRIDDTYVALGFGLWDCPKK